MNAKVILLVSLVAILILFCTCTKPNGELVPQYNFGDEVQLRGFYGRCIGTVIDYDLPNKYFINGSCIVNNNTYTLIKWVSYSDISSKISIELK